MAMDVAKYGHDYSIGISTIGRRIGPIKPVTHVIIAIRTQEAPPFLIKALHDACKTAATNTSMMAKGSTLVTVNMNALTF